MASTHSGSTVYSILKSYYSTRNRRQNYGVSFGETEREADPNEGRCLITFGMKWRMTIWFVFIIDLYLFILDLNVYRSSIALNGPGT